MGKRRAVEITVSVALNVICRVVVSDGDVARGVQIFALYVPELVGIYAMINVTHDLALLSICLQCGKVVSALKSSIGSISTIPSWQQ